MCWKSEIITDINEGKVDTSDIDEQIKVGLYVEYVINTDGNLKSYKSNIKSIDGDNVYLNDGNKIHICAVELYLLYK